MQDRFDNCVKAQGVVKCDSEKISSEDNPLGAFLMAVINIMIETDLEVPDGGDTTH